MHFEHLELTGFRIYDHVALNLGQGVNALVGPNASGKTTVLEALSVLGTGRSFRAATDGEMTRTGAAGYGLRGRVSGRQGSHLLSVRYHGPGSDAAASAPVSEGGSAVAARAVTGRKEFSLDGHSLARSTDLLGKVPLLSFTPDDLGLVKGGPAERRRFLDLVLGQTSGAYRDHLTRYMKALAHRNALLGDLGARRVSLAAADAMLEPWNEALAAEEGEVRAARKAFIDALLPLVAGVFRNTDGRELRLEYVPDEFDPGQAKEELRRGVTLSGPHRDEVLVSVAGQEARRFASQGQQRSVVLALKLAALEILEERCGERPVLLLDDVMSELDPGRGAALLPLLPKGQVFLTTTDRQALERALEASGVGDFAWFSVRDGRVGSE